MENEMEEMTKTNTKVTTVRLDEGDMEKLEDLAKTKYRGTTKAHAMRLMIQDVWEEYMGEQRQRKTGT